MRSLVIAFTMTLLLTLHLTPGWAKNEALPVPRFVSIKSAKANIRSGPGASYPIKWIIVEKNEPVEVIEEYEHWRHIRDYEGEEGWIHKTMLSGHRYAIITGTATQPVYSKPDSRSSLAFYVEPTVRVRITKCDSTWCQIASAPHSGWIHRDLLWGLYPNELVE